MKKFVIGFLFTISFLFSTDIKGFIENINRTDKTIVVNGNTIRIYPYTKIKKDSCWGFDTSANFNELKIGNLVEIDTMIYENILVAEEIEIECNSNRSY